MSEKTENCQSLQPLGKIKNGMIQALQDCRTPSRSDLTIAELKGDPSCIPTHAASSESYLDKEALRCTADEVESKKNSVRHCTTSIFGIPEVSSSHGPGGGNRASQNHCQKSNGSSSIADLEKENDLVPFQITGENLSDTRPVTYTTIASSGAINSANSNNSNVLPTSSNSTVCHRATGEDRSPLFTMTSTFKRRSSNSLTLNEPCNFDLTENVSVVSKLSYPFSYQKTPSLQSSNAIPLISTSLSSGQDRDNEGEGRDQGSRGLSSKLMPPSILTTNINSRNEKEEHVIGNFSSCTNLCTSSTDSPCLHPHDGCTTRKTNGDFPTSIISEGDKGLSSGRGSKNNELEDNSPSLLTQELHSTLKKNSLIQDTKTFAVRIVERDVEDKKKSAVPSASFPLYSAPVVTGSPGSSGTASCNCFGTPTRILFKDFASKVTKLSPLNVLTCYVKPLYTELRHHMVQQKRTKPDDSNASNRSGELLNNGYDDYNGHYRVIIGETILQRYVVTGILGSGSFGKVVRCYDEKWGINVALKITRAGKTFREQAKLEVNILLAINQLPGAKHLAVRLLKVFEWWGHLVLSFELLSYNLLQTLQLTEFAGLSLRFVRDVAFQLLEILQEMGRHRPNGVIHLDLKPENVVLRFSGYHRVTLIDFGSACYTGHSMHTYVQSRFYRSPEVIFHLPYDTAVDRWSLGCMMVELCTGVPLFGGRDEREQIALFESTLGPVPKEMLRESIQARKYYIYSSDEYHLLKPCTRQRTLRSIINEHCGSKDLAHSKAQQLKNPSASLQSYKDPAAMLKHDEEPALEDFLDLVTRLLAYRPSDRISCSDALQHQFFRTSPFLSASRIRAFNENDGKNGEKSVVCHLVRAKK